MDERRFRNELAARIRAARFATWGPKQSRCADALGIRQSQISRWEAGQLPNLYDLVRFAQACNTTVDKLLGDQHRPVLAEQLLLGLEPAAAAVIVDLVQLLKKTERSGRRVRMSRQR